VKTHSTFPLRDRQHRRMASGRILAQRHKDTKKGRGRIALVRVAGFPDTFLRTWLLARLRSRPRKSGDLRHFVWAPHLASAPPTRSCERGYGTKKDCRARRTFRPCELDSRVFTFPEAASPPLLAYRKAVERRIARISDRRVKRAARSHDPHPWM
jgi:hypothetical protein